MEDIDPLDFLPLSATDFQLLLALTAGELHGYAISKSVREASGGRVKIGLGSMYRILARLLSSGLVEECLPQKAASGGGSIRCRYRLTGLGRSVLRAEVARLSDAIDMARSSRLFFEREV